MTIVAIFLFVVPFSCLCAVILLMGFADLWKQREAEKHRKRASYGHFRFSAIV